MVTLRLENPPHLSMIFPAMNFHLVRGFPMTCDTSPALLGAPKSLHVRTCLDSRNQRGGGNPVDCLKLGDILKETTYIGH